MNQRLRRSPPDVVYTPIDVTSEIEEVKTNIARYGDLSVCVFMPGYFEKSLAGFTHPIAVAFVDVDLTESTRQILRGVWPNLVEGGVVFVHDATDSKIASLLDDQAFWREMGTNLPRVRFLPRYGFGFLERESKTLAYFVK